MDVLLLGLVLLLGVHSIRLIAPDWREAWITRRGLPTWKIIYGLLSLAGFMLVVGGYSTARLDPVVLWLPPPWTRHVAALLTLPAFVLLASACLPGTRIRAWLGHPLVAGVKIWALAHLLANGTLADLLLFGSFLVWSVVMFGALRRRDRAQGVQRPAGSVQRDIVAVVTGMIAWAAFSVWLHAVLIGVRPFA